MGSSSLRRFAMEDARDRQLDVAVQEPEQALDLVELEAERRDQALARALAELGARVGEPARAGGAVHAVEARQIVDRELVEHVLAEQVALADLERRERLA